MRLAGCQPLVFDSFCNSGNTCLVFWRRESVLLPGASATTFLPLVPRGDPAAPENLRCEAYTKICVILSPDAMPVQRLCVRFHHTLKRKRAHETSMTRYNRRPACSQRPAKKTAARSEPVAACRFDVRRLGDWARWPPCGQAQSSWLWRGAPGRLVGQYVPPSIRSSDRPIFPTSRDMICWSWTWVVLVIHKLLQVVQIKQP